MQRDGGPYGSAMKNTSLSVLFTYFIVFVFHPAFIAVGLAAMISPGRALAAQSDELYQNLKSKYQLDTPDNDVSKENEVLDIKQKYGKGSGGAEEVIKSLQKYQGQDRAGATVDMGKYQGGNFSSGYQSTYNDAAAGGVGINNLSMPGVSGNNVSVNYAPQGGVKLARDANGNITNTQVGGVKTNDVSSVVGAEASNAETSFGAKNTYNPNNEDDLIREVKSTVSKAQAGGNTSDSVAYRTIMESYRSNKPQNISRDDPAFLGAKSAVDDARLQKGLFDGACKSVTTTTTKQTHYPDWREKRCSIPKKDNYSSCEISRGYKPPLEIKKMQNVSLRSCGDNCIQMVVDTGKVYTGGSCKVADYQFAFKIGEKYSIKKVTRLSSYYDDWVYEKMNGATTLQRIPDGNPGLIFSGDCENNDEVSGGNLDVTSLFTSQAQGAEHLVDIRVALGGEWGIAQITLQFEFNETLHESSVTQTPAGCADLIGWSPLNNSKVCPPEGCKSPIKIDGGVCQATAWKAIDTSTKGLDDVSLDFYKPLFPGDGGRVTWSANAEGYMCDPLAKNKIVVGDKSYSYDDIKNLPDGCAAEKSNPMCIEKSRDCVPGWEDSVTGQCYMQEVVYECDEGKTVSEIVSNTSNTCGELPCIGTDCSAGAQEVNKDFAQTAGLLQAMSFLSADGSCTAADPSQCKVFPGEQKYCGWAVGVVGALADTNCCVAPQGGPDTLSAAMSAFSIIRSMNWQKIASGASEFTGSTSFNAIYNGVSEFGTTIGNATASAIQAAGEAMTSISNTVMSSLGQEVAYEGAKVVGGETAKLTMDGLIVAAQQKVMGALYNTLGKNLMKSLITETVTEEGTTYALTPLASNIVMALNVLMIAYTVYKVTMMIAQMLAACKPEEMETASKIHEKACFKVGGEYCLKKINIGIKKVCVKRAQNYCCYSSMLPRIVMQQAVVQLGLSDCSGITVAQLRKLDWSKIDLTEWVAEATLGGALPDGQDDLTLEALTGTGHVLAGGKERDNTLERLNNRYSDDKLIKASSETQDLIQLDNVDCSYLPRPAICKFQ